jgi:cytochrome c oxidase cbb3-type subunit I
LALAVLFYFIPKLAQAPLHSRPLAIIGFWVLAMFGGWAGFYRGLPLPAWMVSAGIAATAILLVPLIATISNLWLTLGDSITNKPPLLGFFKTSLVFFALGSVFAVFAGLIPQLRLTLFGEGLEQLVLYGFVALALFGAIHYIVPRLTGAASDKFIGPNCWCTLIGIVVYAGAFIVAGMVQQPKLAKGSVAFLDVMNATKPFIRVSTLGILLLIVGNGAILLRVLALVREYCRACCAGCCGREAIVKLKPAEAGR